MLRDHLASIKDQFGNSFCQVSTQNRETGAEGNDPALSVAPGVASTTRVNLVLCDNKIGSDTQFE
jgi:hypothetical protein